MPHIVTIQNVIELIERASELQHPWQKYYWRDGEYVGIKGWDGNSTLHVDAYGDLSELHGNKVIPYNIIVSVEINDDGKMKFGKPSVTLDK